MTLGRSASFRWETMITRSTLNRPAGDVLVIGQIQYLDAAEGDDDRSVTEPG
jgi:hypothetical protein